MRLIYHPEAEAELIEAAKFYELRVSTLGAQFLDAANRAIRIISTLPTGGELSRRTSGTTSCLVFHTPFTTVSVLTTFVFWPSSTTAVTRVTGAPVSPNRQRTPN
jgi:hypothetical protein